MRRVRTQRDRDLARLHKRAECERKKPQAGGRTCKKPDCPTILNSYNLGPYCFIHSAPEHYQHHGPRDSNYRVCACGRTRRAGQYQCSVCAAITYDPIYDNLRVSS